MACATQSGHNDIVCLYKERKVNYDNTIASCIHGEVGKDQMHYF